MILQVRPDYRMAQVLLIACVLFAAIIVVEWAGHRKDTRELAARLAAIGGDKGLVLEGLPEANLSWPPMDAYAEMVERPLFLAERKPLAESPEDASDVAAGGVAEILKAQLMGVVATPRGMTILFVNSQGKYERLREDDSLEGWRIKEVEMDRVVLELGNQVEELLLRKPKPKTPVKTPPRRSSAASGTSRSRTTRDNRKSTRERKDD